MYGPCYQFQQGRCQYGATCRFSHSVRSRSTHNKRDQDNSSRWCSQEFDSSDSELRQWSHAAASTSYAPDSTWNVRVMSYNVLADKLAYEHARELYRNVNRNLLRFRNRVAQMANDFKHLLPDVLSLQEVDKLDNFVDCLGRLGYHHHFAARSGDKVDGCAMFWNAARLRCIDSRIVNFSELGLRDNVAQILVLESCSDHTGQQLVVANTHILFNPKRGDIKVAQIRIILEAVHDMCQLHGGDVPCLFMGDLNLTSDSALYKFIATGQLDCAANDPRTLSGQQESRSGQRPYTPSPSNTPLPHTSPGAQQNRTPPMQPVQQPSRRAKQQARQAVNTKYGQDALEDMIRMGSTNVGHPASSVPDSLVNAGAGPSYPPGLPLPQQRHQLAQGTSASNAGVLVHSTKKVKLDSNGLIAVEHSRAVPPEQPVPPQQQPVPPQLQQPDGTMALPAATAQHWQQQRLPVSLSLRPPTEVPGGLMLHVQEDRKPISPSQLFQSAARGVPPPPHYQPCVDRAPLRIPRPETAPDCGNSSWTPYKQAPNHRHMSSRRGGGMDQEQLAIAHTRETYDPSLVIDSVLQHPMTLQSAYKEVTGSEPEFTSCHDRFCGTVDYIWYTPEAGSVSVTPVAVLNPPPQFCVSTGLPTADFPSDHVSVVCDFYIVPCSSTNHNR